MLVCVEPRNKDSKVEVGSYTHTYQYRTAISIMLSDCLTTGKTDDFEKRNKLCVNSKNTTYLL